MKRLIVRLLGAITFLIPPGLQGQMETSELPLMPWPSNISVEVGRVPINGKFSVWVSGAGANDPRVQFALTSLYARVGRQTGIPVLPMQTTSTVSEPPVNPTMTITVGAAEHQAPQRLGDDEKYSLTIGDGHISLSADHPLGVLRGTQTLLQLIQQNESAGNSEEAGFSVHAVTISDTPRFPWRGLSLDVSRHFIPVDGMKRTIDGLAAVKMNVLHWHLSDDQGFRVESKLYPKLQQMGSDGLFYTQDQIRELIAYAATRGVRVVPEFDMPGHATSWMVGYPELGSQPGPYQLVREHGILTAVMDPTKESTYEFLDGFIGEMAGLFLDKYFHIGGDEVDPKQWNRSATIKAFMAEHQLANAAALQAYFNQRLLKIVESHGKHMVGWDEVLHPDLPKTIVIQSWRGQDSLWKAAREGYQGILSAGYYLDLMYPASDHYVADPMKVPPKHKAGDGPTGSATDLTPEQAKLILGGEAAMWEELATAENLDAKLWPRLAAIAERLWSPESKTDVASMYQRLTPINRWLEWEGLTQGSNLELMRMRLVGDAPVSPLDKFASVLEPVKGYARHRTKFSTATPLNSLVDSVPPESESARRFRVAVDAYLSMPASQRNSSDLRSRLADWAEAAQQVRPEMMANSLLTPDLAVDEGVSKMCQAGLEALDYLDGKKTVPAGWRAENSKVVNQYNNKAVGVILIQIAPGVARLIDAVQSQ